MTAPALSRMPGTLLVALNEEDATYWQFQTEPHRLYLTQGAGRWEDGYRPTVVHVTPDAKRGDGYRRVMDKVHRQIVIMRPERRPTINELPGDQRPVRGE